LLPPLSGLSIGFGYTFSLLTALQFLPQIWTISVRRSIYGLSLLSLALECVSAASNFWNLCILNWFALTSCSVVGLGTCMPYVQPVVQGAALWIVLSVLYGIALHTFANHDMDPMRTDADKDTEFDSQAWLFGLPRRKAIEMLICVAVCLACSILSIFCLVSYGPCNQFTEWVARTQGLINSALTVIQWVRFLSVFVSNFTFSFYNFIVFCCVSQWPQIIMSIQIQERGTLSSLTLIGVLITDIFTIAYLTYMRQDWTAWLSNVMNCAMVICLLAILTYLELDGRGRRRATSTSLAPAAEIPMQVTVRSEQSGLLKSSSRLDSSFDDDDDDELGSHALKLKSFR
jgi:hypothetical protein